MNNPQATFSSAEPPADTRTGPAPTTLSIEDLDQKILNLSARMTAQEYEFLLLVREFDERGGWLKWGSSSCAEWLHWRCDICLSAAREKVRVAHALKALPEISDTFRRGALSYSKARALTRVATPHTEAELLHYALSVSAALVEQRCQQLKNVRPESTAVARRAHDRRSLFASRNRATGVLTLTVELPIEDGELVLNALDKVLEDEPEAADASTSYRARQADALLDLCRDRLNGRQSLRGGVAGGNVSQETLANSATDHYQVVVHADERALTEQPGEAARSDLPVESVRRLTCDGVIVPIKNDGEGNPVGIGRKRRTVSGSLKRALLARDRHCRYPGCTHDRFVHAHHIRHWAFGGETVLDNLMLLCSHHHRLVQEGGFHVFVDNDGHHSFRRPDGRAVPACGYRPEDQIDEDVDPVDHPSAEG